MKSTGAASLTGAAFGLSGCSAALPKTLTFEFDALGAPAFIKLAGIDQDKANNIFTNVQSEVRRLETIFSLYQECSEISRLNVHGHLNHASKDLIHVIQTAHNISEHTHGGFDISVQPLWNVANLIKHKNIAVPDQSQYWEMARALVDYRNIRIQGTRISFAKENMGISLNAIAQGYITDKICELIQTQGCQNALVNIGEYRGFGTNNGTPWKVGVQDPQNIMNVLEVFELNDRALASSSALGGHIGEQVSHIFNVRRSAENIAASHFISASVLHPSAMVADAFATAFTLMSKAEIKKCAETFGDLDVLLVAKDGQVFKIAS